MSTADGTDTPPDAGTGDDDDGTDDVGTGTDDAGTGTDDAGTGTDDAGTGGDDGNGSGDGNGDPGASKRRRRWPLLVAALVVVLALIALWVLFGGERARPSSEDDARRRLGAAGDNGAAPPSVPPGVGAVLGSPPPAGLYRYEGGGEEYTSTPPLTEELGPAMPATVVPGADGCWVFRIDYNTHHWDDSTYCTGDGHLVERGGSTFSRRVLGTFNIDNTSIFTCDRVPLWEGADPPGTKHPRSCSGSGTYITETSTGAGTVTVVGPEQREVEGRAVATMHLRYDIVVTLAQRGTETTDMWFALDTGLPVRNERQLKVTTSSPIGDILYTEIGWYQLTSLRPV
jgi:hypothetical protein